MKPTDMLRLRRLKQLGLVKTYRGTGAPGQVTIVLATDEEATLRDSEVEAYCKGLAQGAWAIHTGAATLPTGGTR